MDVYAVSNMATFLTKAAEQGYQVIGTALTPKSVDLHELEIKKPCIIVFGNEGTGLRQNIINKCETIVKIGTHADAPNMHPLNSRKPSKSIGQIIVPSL